MNPSDDDLNLLLKTWTVPRSPDSLEARLRRAYKDRALSQGAARQERLRGAWARWIGGSVPTAGKLAGLIAGTVVLLAIITRAFPQSLGLIAPPAAITLDSEFLDYKDDGSYAVSEYRTSSWQTGQFRGDVLEGGETVLSRSFPGDPLGTAAGELLSPLQSMLRSIAQRAISPLLHPGRAEHWRAAAIALTNRIRNGCSPTNMFARPMTVIGEETVLNYKTTVSRLSPEGWDVRYTEWFAPGLDCLSLRSTTEKAIADGAFRLTSERRVLRVTTNSGGAAAKLPNR
jgi:hypothetical protein